MDDLDIIKSFSRSDLCSMNRYVALRTRIFCRLTGFRDHYFKNHRGDIVKYGLMEAQSVRLEFLLRRLDENKINLDTYLSVSKEFNRDFPKTLKEHCVKYYGNSGFLKRIDQKKPSGFLKFVFDLQSEMSLKGSGAELKRRLVLATEELLVDQKWFCVLNTLTVDARNYSKVFSKGSKAWREYISDCEDYFAEAEHGICAVPGECLCSVKGGVLLNSVRRCGIRRAARARLNDEDYHQYFAVTERGGQTGRLHIHVLHFFKSVPKDFSDPNKGLRVPYKREIDRMRCLWKYGNSTPIAVRTAQNDAWGSLPKAWIWPVKKYWDPTPLEAHGPGAVMNYVAKYLDKSYTESKKERDYLWRIRLPRRMAQRKISQFVKQLRPHEQQNLLRAQLTVRVQGKSLPKRLLRRKLLRMMYLRFIYQQRRKFFLFLRMWKPLPPFWQKLLEGVKQLLNRSRLKCGGPVLVNMRPTVVFRLFREQANRFGLRGVCYATG